MKQYLSIFSFICVLFLLTGCGHNIVNVDRGIGLDIRVPLPFSGENIVALKVGQIDSTSLILRGNAEFKTDSSTTGSLSTESSSGGNGNNNPNSSGTSGKLGTSGGIGQNISFSTKLQLNEGYLCEVLKDPNVPNEAKIALVNYLIQQPQNNKKK